MRLADKLLLCAAVFYTLERIAEIFTNSLYSIGSYLENIAVYVFLLLALIEYAKLLIPWVKEQMRKRAEKTPSEPSEDDPPLV